MHRETGTYSGNQIRVGGDRENVIVTMASPSSIMVVETGWRTRAMVAIEEVIRSCAIGAVAEAAVASLGGGFAATVGRAANANGMSIGDYAVSSVSRFAREGREGEMRAVASAMASSERPVLAGLQRILTFDLAGVTAARLQDTRTCRE